MTLAASREQLKTLLLDPDNKVIALTGKWGTGKSHLWGEVKTEIGEEKIGSAVYVSLFGVSDMRQLMLKLMQAVVPVSATHPKWQSRMRTALGGVKKVAQSIHAGFSAIDEIALLAVPTMLAHHLIVIDDIERKHEKLAVDEVLGFIDEYTQQFGSRFVLILNSDKLRDLAVWETMREKVVDAEVRLVSSSDDALDIALLNRRSAYTQEIRRCVNICGITNIRVLVKIIKVVETLLGGAGPVRDDVLKRVIPSTVLLCAIHYRAIDDGPDFTFVLEIGNHGSVAEIAQGFDAADQASHLTAWRLLLERLGVNSCDDFEALMIEYLTSGMPNLTGVRRIVERYTDEADLMRAHYLLNELRDASLWEVTITDEELLRKAEPIGPLIRFLDASSVTLAHELTSQIEGGNPLAEQMLEDWIKTHPAGAEFGSSHHKTHWHPRISEHIGSLSTAARSAVTLVDACTYIAEKKAWGTTQRDVINGRSVNDFEHEIRTLPRDDRRLVLCTLIDMLQHREQLYGAPFGSGLDHFLTACRNISSSSQDARLAKLIQILFDEAKLRAHLPPIVNQDVQIPH